MCLALNSCLAKVKVVENATCNLKIDEKKLEKQAQKYCEEKHRKFRTKNQYL